MRRPSVSEAGFRGIDAMGQPAPVCCRHGRNGDTSGGHMKARHEELEETQTFSLDERVQVLETDLERLRRTTNCRNWVIETLLLLILLMGATAWVVYRG
jgi:hypothetical protein